MKWLAIGIGVLSMLIAFLLHGGWIPGGPEHTFAGWLMAAILAAQLTALVLRRWRLSLAAPLLAFAVFCVDILWFGPCHGLNPCTVTIQVPTPSR